MDNQSINKPNKNELKKTEYAKHEDPRSIQDKNEPYKNGTHTTEKDKTEYDKTGQDGIGKNRKELHKTEHDKNGPNKIGHDEKDPNGNDVDKSEPGRLTSNLPCLVFSTPGVAKLSEAAIAEHAREIAFLDDMLALCPELHYTIGTLEIEGQEVLYRVQYWGDRMNVVATNPLDKRVSRRAILFALREELAPGHNDTGVQRH